MAAVIWGIDDGYEDALGQWRKTGEATRPAILKGMGIDPSAPAPPENPVRVLRPGWTFSLAGPAELTLKDGTRLPVKGRPSPFPCSRLFRNPLHLRIEEAPAAAEAILELDRLSALGMALNRQPRIDRDAVFRLKRQLPFDKLKALSIVEG